MDTAKSNLLKLYYSRFFFDQMKYALIVLFIVYVSNITGFISIFRTISSQWNLSKIRRPLNLKAFVDPFDDEITDSEEPFIGDGDVIDEEDEDDLIEEEYEIFDDGIESDSDILSSSKQMTWKERRSMAESKSKSSKRYFDERFEDDPLRSDSPTEEYSKPVDPYTKYFLAIADISDKNARNDAWIYHLQWIRRSTLLPNSPAKVNWEYTRLSSDYSYPIGQILSIRANDTTQIHELFEMEPLAAVGGVTNWKIYEYIPQVYENTTCDLRTPQIFLGFDKSKSKSKSNTHKNHKDLLNQQLEYHQQSSIRTIFFGHLYPIDTILSDSSTTSTNTNSHPQSEPVGTVLVINAKTNKDAQRYIDEDPMVRAGMYGDMVLSPVNQQDVDGRHHVMARTFGQKTMLDQIHFMDPEDLLELELDPLPAVPRHSSMNKEVMNTLENQNISYAYHRLTWTNRYGEFFSDRFRKTYDEDMGTMQKTRIEPVVERQEPEPEDDSNEDGMLDDEIVFDGPPRDFGDVVEEAIDVLPTS